MTVKKKYEWAPLLLVPIFLPVVALQFSAIVFMTGCDMLIGEIERRFLGKK